ncbi:uncharacterized protein LOC109080831 isoform X1 [Cyprinus carpio]|uniref:Uncharacterized protein LOC109080831 isoform X1 n=1 Tax=Cyprinus carpio TaxID=7962 RepID=A0A9Q9XLB8_CYPCA|nr:uncharacterized protein LOC109080831 isoform X1 [Cyprinus carpio]XP_042603919.1 uncharacterized protein LOC109080831 isoform X1 [Cyprinus carpio]
MATATEKDTVWIGFMDIVPVIGTVKEAVELVLALYEGNEAVIKEKEKAVENIVKESSKIHEKENYEKKSVPEKPAAAADEFSGLRNVREVRKEMIIEYMAKGSKRGTKPPTSAEQKERQKTVEAIRKDTLEKIRIIEPNFKEKRMEEIKEELQRSKRGEHVFNNDILKFNSKVLTDFIEKYCIYRLQGYDQQEMNELGRHTLHPDTAENIQTKMVVHFGEDEFYVNANAVMYGEYCRALHEAMLVVLGHINPDDVIQEEKQKVTEEERKKIEEEKQRVNNIIDNMNEHEIYVDQLAKVKWIKENGDNRFNNVKQEVVNMYNKDCGVKWCIRILRKIAPLFGLTLCSKLSSK